MNDNTERDPRLFAIPDTHGHAKGEHKPYAEERPLPLTARMLFLWFYHACRRGYPRFLMVADHMNYLTFEDPAAVNLVRRALKLAQAGDLYGAAETASVDVGHAAVVSEGLRRGMRYSIGAEVDNDPRSRPDAQNIVDAMRPDAIIRSVHFVPIAHPVHGENWPWPFDNPEFGEFNETVGTDALWENYVNVLVDAIERLPGHIVGHFYVPVLYGGWPDDAKLGAYEDRMLEAAAARQMAVEFNTRFLYRDHTDDEKRRYLDANRRLLRKAKERGVGIAIGSDAHSPKDQGGAFDIVLAVLDELEINEIVFPLGGQLRRVALRVVREPEPEPVPEPPAPEPVRAPTREAEPAAKPVRKARTTAKPARATEATSERPPERIEATAPQPAETSDAAAPVEPKAATAKAGTAKAAPAKAAPAKAAPAKAAPVKAAPVKAAPVKAAPVKAAPVKVAPVKARSGKAAPVRIAPAKPVSKPSAKPPSKPAAKPAAPGKKAASAARGRVKAAPAKTTKKPAAPKRAATPAKAAPKRAAAKKATPSRSVSKKAPAKKKLPPKAVAKKAAPARNAAARRPGAAKKSTAKKTAPKRR